MSLGKGGREAREGQGAGSSAAVTPARRPPLALEALLHSWGFQPPHLKLMQEAGGAGRGFRQCASPGCLVAWAGH